MKVHSRIAVIALSLNLLIPTASLARNGADDSAPGTASPEVHSSNETHSPKPESTFSGKQNSQFKPEEAKKFCTNVTTIKGNINETTEQKTTKLKDNFSAQSNKLSQKRAELIAKLGANRTKSDAERTHRFAELESKATTDAQKAAVKEYEASVLAAVAKHRAAIDAADKVFLDGVTAAVGTRQSDLTAATAAYKSAVTAAINQAKVSCAAGVEATTVRQNLSAALKSAQAKFSAARKSDDKVRPNLDPLKSAHKAAIKKANDEFRAELSAALVKLKAALSVTSSPEPSKSSSSSSN